MPITCPIPSFFARRSVGWPNCWPATPPWRRCSQQPGQILADWSRRLFEDANITILLCDYGYQGERAYTHTELQAMLPCRIHPMLRIEVLAEDLIVATTPLTQWWSHLWRRWAAPADGYVALKASSPTAPGWTSSR